MKRVSFGVFAEKGKRGTKLRAYSMWYNAEWKGFVGHFEGEGETRRAAMADALKKARARLNEGAVAVALQDAIEVADKALPSAPAPGFERPHLDRYLREWAADSREREGWKDADSGTYGFRAKVLEAALYYLARAADPQTSEETPDG